MRATSPPWSYTPPLQVWVAAAGSLISTGLLIAGQVQLQPLTVEQELKELAG